MSEASFQSSSSRFHMQIAYRHVLSDWTKDDTEVPGDNTHLWEESWDDDDTSEDFSAQLKYASFMNPQRSSYFTNEDLLIVVHSNREELKKVEANKKR
jgi:hypothetical protein